MAKSSIPLPPPTRPIEIGGPGDPHLSPPAHQHEVRALNKILYAAGYKWCRGCRCAVPLGDFGKKQDRWAPIPPGLDTPLATRCRPCMREYHRGKKVDRRIWRLHARYGLTAHDYRVLLAEQGGGCAICGARPPDDEPFGLFVDHCHKTNVVRGLLCSPCNGALGSFEDSVARLRRAIAYLQRGGVQRKLPA